MLDRLAPALFVLIWSTGWIVAKYVAVAQADPLTFLVLRFATATLVIGGFALAVRAPWPQRGKDWLHGLVSGVLLHAVYLGGVWWAIGAGLPSGLSAVMAALQPLLTAILARPLLGERLSPTNIAGIIFGFVGLLAVLSPKLADISSATLGGAAMPLVINVIAMIGVTAGTFYQKRYVASADLRSVATIQYIGAALVMLPLAILAEPAMRLPVSWETLYALLWSVLVLSIGAISLMLLMIRRGKVSRMASLIFLVPPTAAIQAWLMFDERLGALQIMGMCITALGVYLATRK